MAQKRSRGRKSKSKKNKNECDFEYDELAKLKTMETDEMWELKFTSDLYRVWISATGRFVKVQEYNQYRQCWGLAVVTEDEGAE